MLSLLLIIPLIGIIWIIIVNSYNNINIESNYELNKTIDIRKYNRKLDNIGLIVSIFAFLISIIIWYQFDNSLQGYQFIQIYEKIYGFKFGEIKLGIDGISLYFILLTTLIMPITLHADRDNIKENKANYIIIILLLETLLLAVFSVLDLLLFYISFEATLPPLFILIGYYGSGNKIKASFYLLLYTLFGSLFLLLAILMIYFLTDSTDYEIVLNSNLSFGLQNILWLGMFLSFAVKTPLIGFHIWLNLAHSEAPLGGSILLASIILKLALYGFLRIVIPMLPLASLYFTPFVYLFGTITIIWASLVTLRQIDTKRIVAYSSVGHVAVSLLGAFSNNITGIQGSIILGLAHGLVSPALFIIVGGILYSRYHTRIINYYRGLITYMPLMSLYFFLFTLANCAVPLTCNFIGEFLSLQGAFVQNPIMTCLASSSIVLSAAYSIWLWSRINTGIFSKYLYVTSDLTRRELYILTPLLFLTIFIGIYPNFILQDLEYAVSNIIINI
jgi:NADH-ubiquinone oxidoreductase chain 4